MILILVIQINMFDFMMQQVSQRAKEEKRNEVADGMVCSIMKKKVCKRKMR